MHNVVLINVNKKIFFVKMSGKLIMKRKLDKVHKSTANSKMHLKEPSISSNPSTSSKIDKTINQKTDHDTVTKQPENKRIRCETPPPEPEDLGLPPIPQISGQNRHLLEAIQQKMLELQNELDAFEHDVEAHEEDYYYSNGRLQNNHISEQEAEALGFAMCAQETMSFLEREGIPSDSLLYNRLRAALLGPSQTNEEIIHL